MRILRFHRRERGLRGFGAPRGVVLRALATVVAIGLLATAALANSIGATTRVSVDSTGAQADNNSFEEAISADGRYVAFLSDAANLVPGDTNGVRDVFVHDAQSGITSRVSVDSSGGQGDDFTMGFGLGICSSPSISADGRYVAFASVFSDLVTGDANNWPDVFVHDRQTGDTVLVSVDSSGAQATWPSGSPDISADGRYVVFGTSAPNLVPDDTNGATDVFVHDVQTGTTTRVSVDSSGTQANGHSLDDGDGPAISADGRYVAFFSVASNLVSNDTNGYSDVFVHDTGSGATTRISVDSAGIQGDNQSGDWGVDISADGRYVVFSSYATNLVSGDTLGTRNVFVHECETGTTSSTSVESPIGDLNFNDHPAISANGRYVSFAAFTGNGRVEVLVCDSTTGAIARASVDSAGTLENDSSGYPVISADGSRIAFYSTATNLVADDTNGFGDIFMHDNTSMAPKDATPPTSSCDATSTYFGTATIGLRATDDTDGTGVAGIYWRLDGEATKTAASVVTAAPGPHSLSYWSQDFSGNVEVAKAVDFDVIHATTIALTSKSNPALGYGSTFTVKGTLRDDGTGLVGQRVVLRAAAPGGAFEGSSLVATTASGGAYTFSVRPKTKTYYQVRFAGSTGWEASGPTGSVYALPKVRLTRRTSWSSLSRYKAYYAKGYIEPYHSTRNSNKVKIRAYKKGSDKEWHYVKSFTASYIYSSKSKTAYKAKVVLTSKGSWKLVAYHATDSTNYKTYGSADYITVK